jgi:hypothetical protein
MAQVQQRVLIRVFVFAIAAVWSAGATFYDDDPLWSMPKPMNVEKANDRRLSDYYDYFYMTFGKPGEKHQPGASIAAQAVNTLGEVPDSTWYTNRHARKRMTIEELVQGPGNTNSPSTDSPWKITHAKTEGVTPGFTIKDSKGRTYQLKFDSQETSELGTAADVMGSKFFYALGYNTPENYIVYFTTEQVVVAPDTRIVDYRGVERNMRQSDVEKILADVPRDPRGRYRAVASLYISGKPLGPFRYHGVRSDDPNDTVPHEHRRDLRGLKVFSAWLNHTDSKSLNSHDTLVKEDGITFIKHYLLDFSAAFGTDAFEPKSPRSGFVYMLDWPDAAKSFFTLGLYIPRYARADYPLAKEAGRIESDVFDPIGWKSNYYNPAFENCLLDDGFWAAKIVMSFSDEEIRALVNTSEYSSKEGIDYLARTLIARRDKIGRAYFARVLPLDNFRVSDGRLEFDDLAVKFRMHDRREYSVAWSRFDNYSAVKTPIAGATSASLPAEAASAGKPAYFAAEIRSQEPKDDAKKTVTVYVRANGAKREIVGVERRW